MPAVAGRRAARRRGRRGLLTDQVLFGWKDLLTTLPPLDGDGPAAGAAVGARPGRRAVLGMLLARCGPGRPRSPRCSRCWRRWLLLVGGDPARRRRAAVPVAPGRRLRRPGIWPGWRLRAQPALGAGPRRGPAAPPGCVGGRCAGRRGRAARAAGRRPGPPAATTPAWSCASMSSRRSTSASTPRPLVVLPPLREDGGARPGQPLRQGSCSPSTACPAGTRVRFASLDHVRRRGLGRRRRPSRQPTPSSASPRDRQPGATASEVEVTVRLGEGYSGVWLPTVGALQSMGFDEGDTEATAESFRYNLATSTAVVPAGLRPGRQLHVHRRAARRPADSRRRAVDRDRRRDSRLLRSSTPRRSSGPRGSPTR